MTAKQPAKGGGRKPASSSNAGAALTPEQIAQIATQAAIAAVQQMTAIAPSSEPVRIKPSDLDDEGKADAEEAAEIQAQAKRAKESAARADELARELIPLIVRERHIPVFQWLKGSNTDAGLVKDLLASSLAKALPKYREANGQLSASSTNIQLLADNLPGKQ